jgi:predicted O-methyltransferase YrrM
MDDFNNIVFPAALAPILEETVETGFTMACEPQTGAILRTLAAAKPGASILEIGTGTGVGSGWLLDGMDSTARLTSVEKNGDYNSIAIKYLGQDARANFITDDAVNFLTSATEKYDLIFADTHPGKFSHLAQALDLLKPGGLYIIDDLIPQPTWPENHEPKVAELIATLEARPDLVLTRLAWASGMIIAAKK